MYQNVKFFLLLEEVLNGETELLKIIKLNYENLEDSGEEIIAKLTQLGFIKNESTKIKSKNSDKSKEKDLSTQLVEITELYKSGSITEDEYKKAKNKLLGK